MKRLVSIFVLCLSMLFVAGSVEARDHRRRGPQHRPHRRPHHPPQHRPDFECKAQSPFAVGFGVSQYRDVAARIALSECAIRTPHEYVCRLSWCRVR